VSVRARPPVLKKFLQKQQKHSSQRKSPTAEVFGELHITPSTVRDQFESIFDKVGVRSRRELVGQVFAQQYQTRMATGHEPGTDGWCT